MTDDYGTRLQRLEEQFGGFEPTTAEAVSTGVAFPTSIKPLTETEEALRQQYTEVDIEYARSYNQYESDKVDWVGEQATAIMPRVRNKEERKAYGKLINSLHKEYEEQHMFERARVGALGGERERLRKQLGMDKGFQKAFNKYFPYLEAAAGVGLLVVGGLQGLKAVKDVYNWARVGKVITQLNTSDKRALFSELQKGNYPEFMKGMTGAERVQFAGTGRRATYEIRPIFRKMEGLFKKVGMKDVKPLPAGRLIEAFAGPGVPAKTQKEIEAAAPTGLQRFIEAQAARGVPAVPASPELGRRQVLEKYGAVFKGEEEGIVIFDDPLIGTSRAVESKDFSEKAVRDKLIETYKQFDVPRAEEAVDRPQMLQYIKARGGLPEEPQARKAYMNTAISADKIRGRFEKRGKENLLNPLSSMRYSIAQMEVRSGVAGLHRDWVSVQGKTAARAYNTLKSFRQSFIDAGVKYTDVIDDREAEESVQTWLFEENPTRKALLWNGMSKTAQGAATVLNERLQGKTATALRYLRWSIWNRGSKDILNKLAELRKQPKKPAVLHVVKQLSERAKRISILEAQMKKIIPPDASVETMREADSVFEVRGKEGLMGYLAGQTWGTRKHYYMAEQDFEDLVGQFAEVMIPGEGIEPKQPGAVRAGKMPGEARTRRGKAIMKKGALIPTVYSHISRVEMMADMFDDVQELSKKFTEAGPSGRDIALFRRNIRNAVGIGESVPDAIRFAEGGNRFFWMTYPWVVSRALWYTARNLPWQNVAFGLGQLPPTQIAKASARLATDITTGKLSPAFKEDFEEGFKARISQKLPMWQQFMMLGKGNIAPKANKKLMRGLDIVGQVIPLSDEGNRLLAFPVAYYAAEASVNAYKAGKISFGKLSKNLKLGTLHLSQQLDLQDMIKEGNARGAIFRIAEMKTENVHHKYRTSERSGIEQYRAARPFVGLYNWPRGMVEAVYQNGIKPLYYGIEDKDWNKAYTALGSVLGTFAGFYAAREGLAKLVGKKSKHGAYDMLETLSSYGPGSAGLGTIESIFSELGGAVEQGRQGNWSRAIDLVGNRAAYHLPLITDMINAYEMTNDRRGVKATKRLRSLILKRMRKDGLHVKRDPVQAWQHLIFGTEERPEKKISMFRTPPATDYDARLRRLQQIYGER